MGFEPTTLALARQNLAIDQILQPPLLVCASTPIPLPDLPKPNSNRVGWRWSRLEKMRQCGHDYGHDCGHSFTMPYQSPMPPVDRA